MTSRQSEVRKSSIWRGASIRPSIAAAREVAIRESFPLKRSNFFNRKSKLTHFLRCSKYLQTRPALGGDLFDLRDLGLRSLAAKNHSDQPFWMYLMQARSARVNYTPLSLIGPVGCFREKDCIRLSLFACSEKVDVRVFVVLRVVYALNRSIRENVICSKPETDTAM